MEILFMVFMVVVSIMALFAVMVVLRDIVREVFASRRKEESANENIVRMAERLIAESQAKEEKKSPEVEVITVTETAPAEESTVSEPEPEPVEEAPEEEIVVAPIEEIDDGKISFSTGSQKTLDEKYLELPAEMRGWYDEIIKYASAVEGSKRFKTARYEEYKVGKNRLVRLLIKRGIINCEFILHNSDFKNYISENKISVKQSATTMLVESAATIDAVKNSIDIVVAFIAEEKEYKKKMARERRRAARAAEAAADAEAESTVKA